MYTFMHCAQCARGAKSAILDCLALEIGSDVPASLCVMGCLYRQFLQLHLPTERSQYVKLPHEDNIKQR